MVTHMMRVNNGHYRKRNGQCRLRRRVDVITTAGRYDLFANMSKQLNIKAECSIGTVAIFLDHLYRVTADAWAVEQWRTTPHTPATSSLWRSERWTMTTSVPHW